MALFQLERFEEAVAELGRAIMLRPDPNYYYHRSKAYSALGDERKAAQDSARAGISVGQIGWDANGR